MLHSLFYRLFIIALTTSFILVLNITITSVNALEPQSIQKQSSKFIVRIGRDFGGTGFFVRKNNYRYTILTNRHVVENPSNHIIFTPDGKNYPFSTNNIRLLPGLDLAEVEINSDVNYPIAKLSNDVTHAPGSIVYVYGWNAVGLAARSRALMWIDGKVTGQLNTNGSFEGYSLAYTLPSIKGLSGSAVLNERGEVIGVYGSGEGNSFGLGIPIATYRNSTITTASGLKYFDITIGTGAAPKKGQIVEVHYTGTLENGNKFDSSYDRNQTFRFQIGEGQVLKAWDEGLSTMKVGGRRQLIIPAELGYGSRGAGGVIPPNATLLFDVEIISIE
jgi:FKBP-type peptidyl-prolyl cis-trans isomerase/Trypsin-like peptidase domain